MISESRVDGRVPQTLPNILDQALSGLNLPSKRLHPDVVGWVVPGVDDYVRRRVQGADLLQEQVQCHWRKVTGVVTIVTC